MITIPRVCASLLAVCAGVLLPPTCTAQNQSAGGTAALAVVHRLFDAMRAGDSAGVRSVFHPAAQLVTARLRDGAASVEVDTVDAFVRAVGTPHPEVWDERLRSETVHVDGPLVVVWAEYSFYAGDKFSHCGVDAFQLARGSAGWQVVQIMDTRRRSCPE